ncbi:MAG: branched-chain-amino-acid transaminase [Deltaproteobacteria bacterium]|nr:branched-chain-amino-acid transaminase [Deltaproteobacteria bacterium]
MVPMQEAKISVLDRGFQYGDGVFEGLRAYDGKIFKLKEHVDRLFRSAKAVDIEIPLTKEEFSQAVKRVVRENKFTEAHIKPQVTRGIAWKLGLDPRNATQPNVVIPARPIGKSMFDIEAGFKLASVSVRKIPAMCLDPRIKSCNYLVHILARAEALASGADEAIILDIFGYVSEGCGDNIFLVKDGQLYTPAVQDALEGITRETVIDLARRAGLTVHETRLTTYDVYTADEVFVTGSGAGIVPVTEVDKRPLSGGRAGQVTKQLIALYDQEAQTGEPVYD